MGQVPPKPILKLCAAAPPVENVMRGVMRGVACGPGLCAAATSVPKVMQGCPACVNDYARAMCGLCASYAQSYAHLLKTQPQLAGASPHPRGLIFFKTSEHLKVARA